MDQETKKEKIERLREEFELFKKQFSSSKSFDDIVFYANMMANKIKEIDKLSEEV
jgi:hypothetical protein